MRRISFYTLAVAAVLCFLLGFSQSLSAQRQTPGRPSVEVFSSVSKPFFSGAGFTWNNHFYRFHSSFGVEWYRRPESINVYVPAPTDVEGTVVGVEENSVYDSQEFDALAGILFRLWAPRNRVVILNAGMYLDTGVRLCEPMKNYTYDGKRLPTVSFMFGLVPEVQAEVFPFKNLSLYASFRPRIYIIGMPYTAKILRDGVLKESGDWYQFAGAFGIKLYI